MTYPGRSGQPPWVSGQRAMGGWHHFLHDPAGVIPRPKSAVAQSHHMRRSNSLVHISSRGYHSQAGPSSRTLPLSPEFGSPVAHYPTSEDVTMAQRPQSSGHSTKSVEQVEQEMNVLQEKVKHLEPINHLTS